MTAAFVGDGGPNQELASRVDRFDRCVDERLADRLRGNGIADRLFYAASAVGDHGLVWLIVANLLSLTKADQSDTLAATAAVLGVESVVVNGPIKWLFRRPRPTPEADAPHPLRIPTTSSFPSGHATSAFCAATLLGERDPSHRVFYFSLAAVIAWSRVHVRLHHASDVLGGAAIGLALGQAATRAVARLSTGSARRP